MLLILVGKYIGFWQAVVQSRIWLPIKNTATVYHIFILSVSNSTAYWLHCINNYIYHNCVRYHATAAWSATGRSAYM